MPFGNTIRKKQQNMDFPYTYKAVPYAGKPADRTGPYYINRTQGYVEYLVTETMKDTNLKGRSISTDRLYTSVEQAEWLLERRITDVGTLLTNRIGIPAELKECKTRDVYSRTCHFEKEDKDLCLMSYTVKTKSKGKKNVLMLSTMRPLHGVTKDEAVKQATYKFYDFTKGGTDIVDQMNDYYSTRSKSLRWDMVALFYMLDTTRVNARTVWCFSQNLDISEVNRHAFGWQLAMELTKPFVDQRNKRIVKDDTIKKRLVSRTSHTQRIAAC